MIKRLLTAFAVVACCSSAIAQEAHKPGFYLGLNGGLSFLQNSTSKLYGKYVPASLSFERGWTAGAVAGYDFGRFFRAELEFNYKKANMDLLSKTFGAKTYKFSQDGSVRTLSYMANAYLQYPLTDYVVPYIGVGVGLADVRMDKVCVFRCGGTTDKHLLAYQGIVGVGVNVTPNVTLSFDYRYFTTKEGKFETGLLFHPTMKTRISSHNAMMGIRYKF